MKEFIFHEASPDEQGVFDFEPTIFHHVSHLRLQRIENWKWFYATHERHHRVVASLYLNVFADMATSVIRSPFGTVECSDNIPPETLYRFLQFVEDVLRQSAVNHIQIKTAPYAYAPRANALLYTFLGNLGYAVVQAEASACIVVGKAFGDNASRTELNLLQKAKDSSLHLRFLAIDHLEEVYKFIAFCHQEKDYQLSMTLDELSHTVQQFPDRFLLVGVYQNQKLVSASIVIRISHSILYTFYLDHDPAFDKQGPVVFMIKGLYDFCSQNSITLLDLGTSAKQGKPKFSLLSFKLRLGAEPAAKLTFEKVFER